MRVSVDFLISKQIFAGAIATYCRNEACEFNFGMPLHLMKEVIGKQLFFYGIEGLHKHPWHSTDEKFVELYNKAYRDAEAYFERNRDFFFNEGKAKR